MYWMNIMDPIRAVEMMQERARKLKRARNAKGIHMAFLDLSQAFDRTEFLASDMALERLNVPPRIRKLMRSLDTTATRTLATRDG